METPIEDIAYLTRSEHRAPTLIHAQVRPPSRSELWEMAGFSVTDVRKNTQYEFISERPPNACETSGIKSTTFSATR